MKQLELPRSFLNNDYIQRCRTNIKCCINAKIAVIFKRLKLKNGALPLETFKWPTDGSMPEGLKSKDVRPRNDLGQ